MDLAYLRITDFSFTGDEQILVKSEMSTSWDVSQSAEHRIAMDMGVNLLALAKQMVIVWAADPNNGGKTLTPDQVIVVGGIQ